MSFFQNARNVGINSGKFFTVNGDYNNISVGSGAYPNATLCSSGRPAAAASANLGNSDLALLFGPGKK